MNLEKTVLKFEEANVEIIEHQGGAQIIFRYGINPIKNNGYDFSVPLESIISALDGKILPSYVEIDGYNEAKRNLFGGITVRRSAWRLRVGTTKSASLSSREYRELKEVVNSKI